MVLRTLATALAALVYIVALPQFAAATSVSVAAIPAVAILVWVATNDIVDALPSTSGGMLLLGALALAVVGALFVGQQTTGILRLGGYVIGFAGGAVGFLLGTIFVKNVAASILGVDLEEHERRKQRQRTNDPYGDKHAAKILDEQ